MKRKLLIYILTTILLLILAIVPVGAASNLMDNSGKSVVCHKFGTVNQQTIEVEDADLNDHLGHGDIEGECAPLQQTVEYTCSTSDIEYELIYVSSKAGAAQKGTLEQPFKSVSSALQYAEKMNFPGVELQIGSGVYGDDTAVLSRPTRIVGPGQDENVTAELSLSIVNEGAYDLGVQGVVFQAANSGPAIRVSNLDANTELCNVHFEGVLGHALKQTGGSINIKDSVFNATVREPQAGGEDHLTGTAILLDGGVTGSMTNIRIDGSAGSGLHMSGPSTMIYLDWDGSGQSVIQNGIGCLGALVVKDGAELNASHLTLDGNAVRGAYIEGIGTTAYLPFLTAISTRYLEGGSEKTFETCGTNAISNVVAASGAALNITGTPTTPFVISNSPVVGLLILLDGPTDVTLSYGIISNNLIGLSNGGSITDCQNTPYPYYDYVTYTNNGVDIDWNCPLPPPPILAELACDDGVDNDQDGLTDCADVDCSYASACIQQ